MTINLDANAVGQYRSSSQMARVLTESWIANNMFCPKCGHSHITQFENNRPVADFFCPSCKEQYELKSKQGKITHKVNDGAYSTMIQRITSNVNPNFFFMNYSIQTMVVKDLFIVPKHFFTPEIIEKRNPLSPDARRSGWIGCNILLCSIPEQGCISIIKNSICQDIQVVIKKLNKTQSLATADIEQRGWLLDILNCINSIQSTQFSLHDIYQFEAVLQVKHPKNQNIRAKIRQQLQILRDKGYIEFLGKGQYKK